MRSRRTGTHARIAVASFVVVWLLAPLLAQKGKTTKTATGTFRCPGVNCPTDPVAADRIESDGLGAYGGTDGAAVDRANEFSLWPANGRFLSLDFSDGAAVCGLSCRRDFQTIQIDATHTAGFHTNVIDPGSGGEAAYGLMSIPVGATWPSRLKIAFNTVSARGEETAWAVRFNPRDYPPSDHVLVTRTSTNSWEVFATTAERAMLVSVCCGQKSPMNEGLYAMPFRLLVTTP